MQEKKKCRVFYMGLKPNAIPSIRKISLGKWNLYLLILSVRKIGKEIFFFAYLTFLWKHDATNTYPTEFLVIMELSFILLKYDFFFLTRIALLFPKIIRNLTGWTTSLPERENSLEINLNYFFSSPKLNLK